MVCLDARFLSVVFLLVVSRAFSIPLADSKNSEDPATASNEKPDEQLIVLVDDGESEFFLLDPVSAEAVQSKETTSDAAEATSDIKEKQDSERILFKKFFYSRPVAPVAAVLPVAILQPQVPQVVRVPSSFKVVVGAQRPHVYVLRPPHYRPVLVSTGLGAAGLAGGLSSLGVAGLTAGLPSLGAAGLSGGLQPLSLSVLPHGLQAIGAPGLASFQQQQQPLVGSLLPPAVPQVAQPIGVNGGATVLRPPQPSASLLSGMLTNLMSLGTRVPTSPVQPVPSLPVIPRPTVAPATTIDFQVQKVVDVMAHAKEDQAKEK